MNVRSADPNRANGEDYFANTGDWIGGILNGQAASAEKDKLSHKLECYMTD